MRLSSHSVFLNFIEAYHYCKTDKTFSAPPWQVLDYSKLEASKVILRVAPFKLRACLENLVSMLRGPIDQKRLDFLLNIPAECPEQVYGDEARLTQVLTKYELWSL